MQTRLTATALICHELKDARWLTQEEQETWEVYGQANETLGSTQIPVTDRRSCAEGVEDANRSKEFTTTVCFIQQGTKSGTVQTHTTRIQDWRASWGWPIDLGK